MTDTLRGAPNSSGAAIPPDTVRWIAEGRAVVTIRDGKDGTISPSTLSQGDMTGLSAPTNRPSACTCVAQTELTGGSTGSITRSAGAGGRR